MREIAYENSLGSIEFYCNGELSIIIIINYLEKKLRGWAFDPPVNHIPI